MTRETICTRTKSNGPNSRKSESGQEEIEQSEKGKLETELGWDTYNEAIKLSWNELTVTLTIGDIRFDGHEALNVIRWINSLCL